MADRFAVIDMQQALKEKGFPTVTLWNRVEGRPRTVNFERGLRAEVCDALWMLSRQWQVGEFAGEDAGSHLFVPGELKPDAAADDVALEVEIGVEGAAR